MVDATLVTVHGFWSSPATWDPLCAVWQADDELEGLRVHGFGYPSPKMRRLPFSWTRVPDFADIAQMLAAEYATKLGRASSIAFVTHSQGGLILQRFLAWMISEGRARELARIRTIIVLACPNGGSQYFASIRHAFGYGRHPQAADLEVLSKQVADTQRAVLAHIVHASGVDDHQCRIPFHVYAAGSDAIVSAASAQSAFPGAGTLAGNHFTILDPAAPGNSTADIVKHHILADLTERPPASAQGAAAAVPARLGGHGKPGVSLSRTQGVQVGDRSLQSRRSAFMSPGARPIVYISYRWIDIKHQGRAARAPDPQGKALADRLRERGVDVRLDMYYSDSLHGFSPPQLDPDDPRDPWLAWATQQIAEADAVLMLCTPDYAQADRDDGERFGEWSNWCELAESTRIKSRVPSLWWDWLAIARESSAKPDKFIPVGPGPYHADLVPAFVRGASYQNLDSPGAIDALLRRIRRVWRARVPRRGVFISYAHDDQARLDTLLGHLSWIRDRGVEIWTDRDITPGALWHETIQAELDLALVAILMVSPAFLASPYISNEELPRMLDAAAADGLTIFWIPVRPSAYQQSPIVRFQAAHAPDKPLAMLKGAKRDQAFVEIGKKLAEVLDIASG